MRELIQSHLLAHINAIWPTVVWLVFFAGWSFLLLRIGQKSTLKNLLNNPKLIDETVRHNIRLRDEKISRLEKENEELEQLNKSMWAAIRGSINQLTGLYESVNEILKKRKSA
jgi:hypothetical protein